MLMADFYFDTKITINYNMRCIEITYGQGIERMWLRINYNMRCIEISLMFATERAESMINYNMRCIEIASVCSVWYFYFR